MLLLVVLGVCASILDYGIESGVRGLSDLRNLLLSMESMQSTSSIKFLVWSAFTFTVALLGMLCTRFVDPIAAGSGIPEMKNIISCDLRKEADDFLGRRTLVSKAVGLMLAMGSGISLGKEGPFVHTASIIAHQLMKHIGFFQRIYESAILRRHMYNAACAVGIASTFRAPIGGVLFAIEVTSTVFMVTNYWRAFVAAISASIARQLISLIRETEVTAFHPIDIIPGGYALVGGVAFVGSATHTVSVAVIAMEFTGQFIYITPLILAVLLASGIGSALSVSLYESIIISKGLTYLPLLRVNQLEGFTARDVMDAGFSLIPLDTSSLQLQSVLDRTRPPTHFRWSSLWRP
ncbi:hypothetical protein Poli38472_009803 [Pythium oligandrum]|uniref:Chloride channel protein n=1 Tax=Pythium oligandrum TaxID=41045 RepID=A0A8K1FG26_PYTOL|nr:hypothetical protein Poli38472_009803 [Pythium oligandrum]|eukprot:TMW62310.1 hypothetical protein Poli38472_009803 [Pythium oligandrum]